MNRLNKKGFTLIELLAVFVLLAIIMGLGSYSIIGIINNTREKDYKLLINNIYSAVEEYYIECKYDDTAVSCPVLTDGWYSIKLSDLVDNGYLKGNSVITVVENGISKEKSILVNPKEKYNDSIVNDTNKDNAGKVIISDCKIKYSYSNGKIMIEESYSPTGYCPKNCDYNPDVTGCKK